MNVHWSKSLSGYLCATIPHLEGISIHDAFSDEEFQPLLSDRLTVPISRDWPTPILE